MPSNTPKEPTEFERELDADLDAELSREKDHAEVEVVINKKLRRIRVWEMDALEWAEATDRCPQRDGVKFDEAYGFDIRKLVGLIAPQHARVKAGDEWVQLDAERWRKLFRSMSGVHWRAVGDQVFALNAWGPIEAVMRAKKASAVESVKNLSSPAASESPDPV